MTASFSRLPPLHRFIIGMLIGIPGVTLANPINKRTDCCCARRTWRPAGCAKAPPRFRWVVGEDEPAPSTSHRAHQTFFRAIFV
jgi:hypothetical protein